MITFFRIIYNLRANRNLKKQNATFKKIERVILFSLASIQ